MNPSTGAGAFTNNIPCGYPMMPMHQQPRQFLLSYLKSSTLPRTGKSSTAGHALSMLCGGIRLQHSPSLTFLRENEAKNKVTIS